MKRRSGFCAAPLEKAPQKAVLGRGVRTDRLHPGLRAENDVAAAVQNRKAPVQAAILVEKRFAKQQFSG
jgi:uncharacterized caspase-like protein